MKMGIEAPFYQKRHPSDKARSVWSTSRCVSSNEQGSDIFTSPAALRLLVAACITINHLHIDISSLLVVAPFAGFTASECIFPQLLVVGVFYK